MTANTNLSADERFLVDFNLQMVPAALGIEVPPSAAAAMFGISQAGLANYIAEAEATVRQTARRLLQRPELAAALDGWALPAGATVLAVGDSITTYRYSFARILAAMLDWQRERDAIRFLNAGQSGYTSTHGRETTFTQSLALQPDWVFVKFGVNDCKRFGDPGSRTLVSLDEYRANMTAIVTAYRRFTAARIVLLTPTPVVEPIANTLPDFVSMRMIWDNRDLAACAQIVHELAGRHDLPVVDLVTTFGRDPDPAYYLPDGLHPNPAGHEVIVDAVLTTLNSWKP